MVVDENPGEIVFDEQDEETTAEGQSGHVDSAHNTKTASEASADKPRVLTAAEEAKRKRELKKRQSQPSAAESQPSPAESAISPAEDTVPTISERLEAAKKARAARRESEKSSQKVPPSTDEGREGEKPVVRPSIRDVHVADRVALFEKKDKVDTREAQNKQNEADNQKELEAAREAERQREQDLHEAKQKEEQQRTREAEKEQQIRDELRRHKEEEATLQEEQAQFAERERLTQKRHDQIEATEREIDAKRESEELQEDEDQAAILRLQAQADLAERSRLMTAGRILREEEDMRKASGVLAMDFQGGDTSLLDVEIADDDMRRRETVYKSPSVMPATRDANFEDDETDEDAYEELQGNYQTARHPSESVTREATRERFYERPIVREESLAEVPPVVPPRTTHGNQIGHAIREDESSFQDPVECEKSLTEVPSAAPPRTAHDDRIEEISKHDAELEAADQRQRDQWAADAAEKDAENRREIEREKAAAQEAEKARKEQIQAASQARDNMKAELNAPIIFEQDATTGAAMIHSEEAAPLNNPIPSPDRSHDSRVQFSPAPTVLMPRTVPNDASISASLVEPTR